MIIQYLRRFKQQYRQLPPPLQQRFDNRLRLFVINPTHPRLRIHLLKGKYAGYWSMNVSGDVRAIYYNRGDTIVISSFGTN